MALIKVRMVDYSQNYSYAPPQEDAILNTEEIVSAVPTEARGDGPFLRVNLKDGTRMVIVGTVDDVLQPPSSKGVSE